MRQIKSLLLIFTLCTGLIFLDSCAKKTTMRGSGSKNGKIKCPIKDC